MKHLRKYNEASDEEVYDKDYIEQCFIEFYDNPDKWDMQVIIGYRDRQISKYGTSFVVRLKNIFSGISKDSVWFSTMEEYLKHTDDMNEFALDINACTDRLKQQYNVKSTKINLLNSNPNVIDICFYVDNSKNS